MHITELMLLYHSRCCWFDIYYLLESIVYPPCSDIVKLTAQFVARNGAMFLDKLMMREQRNYQFDFLRKQHPLFNYFTKLVEQYSKVLLPPKDLKNRLTEDLERPVAVRLGNAT